MDAPRRDPSVEDSLTRLFDLIDKEDFTGALDALPEVEAEARR